MGITWRRAVAQQCPTSNPALPLTLQHLASLNVSFLVHPRAFVVHSPHVESPSYKNARPSGHYRLVRARGAFLAAASVCMLAMRARTPVALCARALAERSPGPPPSLPLLAPDGRAGRGGAAAARGRQLCAGHRGATAARAAPRGEIPGCRAANRVCSPDAGGAAAAGPTAARPADAALWPARHARRTSRAPRGCSCGSSDSRRVQVRPGTHYHRPDPHS